MTKAVPPRRRTDLKFKHPLRLRCSGAMHGWLELLRRRTGRSARKLWRCPLCKQCQYVSWHKGSGIVTSDCPKCGQSKCAANRCGHTTCQMCGIGHGVEKVDENRMCWSCTDWKTNHPDWKEPKDSWVYEEEFEEVTQ